jgi:hypothetical protein
MRTLLVVCLAVVLGVVVGYAVVFDPPSFDSLARKPVGPLPDVPPPAVEDSSDRVQETMPTSPEPSVEESAEPSRPVLWVEQEAELREKPDPDAERVRRDLETTRVSVDFRSTPIEEVARALAEQSGAEIAVAIRCYEERTRAELQVTLESRTASIAEALDLVCEREKLVWWVEGEKVTIAPTLPRPEIVEVRYPLGDSPEKLLGHEPDGIADLIREKVDPAVWDEMGKVRREGYVDRDCVLVVRAPKATQRKVLALLRERARMAARNPREPGEEER